MTVMRFLQDSVSGKTPFKPASPNEACESNRCALIAVTSVNIAATNKPIEGHHSPLLGHHGTETKPLR